MKDPTACAVTEAAFSHPIEEELEEPDGAGERGKEIIIGKRGFFIRVIAEGLIAGIEDHAPDEVGGEAAPEQDHIGDVVLVEEVGGDVRMGGFPEVIGGLGHGRSRLDAIVEAGAQDTGDGADDEAFGEVELFDAFLLFFLGQFAFLEHAGAAADIDTEEAEDHAGENDAAPVGCEEFVEGCFAGCVNEVIVDGGYERAEGRCESEEDRVAQGHSEIAHAEAIHETADPPEDTPEKGPGDDCRLRLADDGGEIGNGEPGCDGRNDEPGEEAADDPIAFPGPAFDLFERDVEAARGESADEVEEDAEEYLHVFL